MVGMIQVHRNDLRVLRVGQLVSQIQSGKLWNAWRQQRARPATYFTTKDSQSVQYFTTSSGAVRNSHAS